MSVHVYVLCVGKGVFLNSSTLHTCTCMIDITYAGPTNPVCHGRVLRRRFHEVLASNIMQWTAPIKIHSINISTIGDQFLDTPCVASCQGQMQGSLLVVISSIYITAPLVVSVCVMRVYMVCLRVCSFPDQQT